MSAECIVESECQRMPFSFKLVVLGSSGVGKSSLVMRYVKDDFRELPSTVGCAFFTQLVCLNNTTIKFEIWDTAGQEKYHSVCHLYYRGANAAILVYDVTSKETFIRAQLWLRELEREFSAGDITIALIGNKTDLSAERQVTSQEAQIFAEDNSVLFMETSAKDNYNVSEAFLAVAEELLQHEQHKEVQSLWSSSCVELDEADLEESRQACCHH
ncbi:ras-related protein Rab-17 [Ambystoma mexicanum]|uniref:ras-related protein Rab-17 n=1 Tax=Ambystoma mexicanum TaxID=8296 RepID=UPI0037E91503